MLFCIPVNLSIFPFEKMHFPVNISIGRWHIPGHLLCETLAYFAGYRYYVYLRQRQHDDISENNRFYIFLAAAFGAFLGSHIVGVLENSPDLKHWTIVYFLGNKTIIGGFLGGLIGVELVKKFLGVKVSSGDMMVYPLILAMIIGRTGCFLAGLDDGTYGDPSNLPWAINMGDGIPRHPTNLYEILFWIMLWVSLLLLERRYRLANGARFKLFLSAYLAFRFLIEFIKPDYFFAFGLSTIQLVCLAGILYYYRVFLYPLKLIRPYA